MLLLKGRSIENYIKPFFQPSTNQKASLPNKQKLVEKLQQSKTTKSLLRTSISNKQCAPQK